MGYFIFMLIMDLLIPAMLLGFGAYFKKRAPKEINYLFGYRTRRSMQNEKTWAYAHKMLGKLWWRFGFLSLTLCLPLFFFIKKGVAAIGTVGTILCLVQFVPIFLSIILVERALKKKFDENGNEKE